MRLFKLLLVFSCLLIFQTSNATQYYRHVPFTLSLTKEDKVTVNYDYSTHSGIHCTSDYTKFFVNFTYKGHAKTAQLPVTLESDHVPVKSNEELANVSGQFTIVIDTTVNNHRPHELSCDYI